MTMLTRKKAVENDEPEFIGIPEAVEIARSLGISVSRPTAASWVKKFRLGHQPGGTIASPGGLKWTRWLISRKRWIDFLMGRP